MLKEIFTEEAVLALCKNPPTKCTGSDGISLSQFKKNYREHAEVILRKVHNGTYKFSSYKVLVESKGVGKLPRPVCIPTIRDGVVLKLICNRLTDDLVSIKGKVIPQKIARELKDVFSNPEFNRWVNFDLKDFYPSIDRSLLYGDLQVLDYPNDFNDLVISACSTNGLVGRDRVEFYGVPQGLSISNVLAEIYMINLDSTILSLAPNSKIYRYVDDMVIVFKDKLDEENIKRKVDSVTSDKYLSLNLDKTDSGSVDCDVMSFIGYTFIRKPDGKVLCSVRQKTIDKLKNSLKDTISSKIKYPKKWGKLNVRISGFRSDGSIYGWVSYFSAINDYTLLKQLDLYVDELKSRYGYKKMRLKRFVKSHKEINKNARNSKYFWDIDSDKGLSNATGNNLGGMSKSEKSEFRSKTKSKLRREAT